MIWENVKTFHHRIMMRYLRKRGWVVFYLEERHRKCNGMCWLELYKKEDDVTLLYHLARKQYEDME